MDIFKYLGIYFISSGALTALIGFLARSIFNHYMDKRIEMFKNELSITLKEHEIMFSKLHEKRAEVISILYSMLYKSTNHLTSLFSLVQYSGEPSEEEKIKIAVEEVNGFINFYYENKIYFNEDICKILEDIIKVIKTSWSTYDLSHMFKPRNKGQTFSKETYQEYYKYREEAWSGISEKVPELRKKIENEFRILIGVNNPNS